jgi:hypothetical protein
MTEMGALPCLHVWAYKDLSSVNDTFAIAEVCQYARSEVLLVSCGMRRSVTCRIRIDI